MSSWGSGETRVFLYNGFCYSVTQGAGSPIPASAIVITPNNDYPGGCSTCGNGVQVTVCPNQPFLDPIPYVLSRDLPPAGTVQTWRYHGWCVQVNGSSTPVQVPSNAATTVPLNAFISKR